MSPSTRTPRAIAKRIDRLARYAHAFHRFAHHPLCESYRGELVTIGKKTRLCRGCLFAALGSVSGVAVGLFMSKGPVVDLCAILVSAVFVIFSIGLRLPKLVARFTPAGLASAAVTGALGGIGAGDTRSTLVLGVAVLLGCGGFVLYRRRGPNRSACQRCPERLSHGPCSGISSIIRRERAFQRLSQRWLDAVPK